MNLSNQLTAPSQCSANLRSFSIRETTILSGIRIYLRCVVGEYFTSDEIERFCENLLVMRKRPADCSFPYNLVKVVSRHGEIRSRFIPRKTLRKDELAILIYNLAPYSFLNRKESALFAKYSFPCFFSKPSTIYGTFTKYLGAPMTDRGNELYLSITNFPFHSNVKLEEEMIRLAVDMNDSNQ